MPYLMTKLSVNINKVALVRNARGGNLPDLAQVAADCEAFGAQGITVHPRPDQRHIRYDDIPVLREVVKTEFNIEGYPASSFMELVMGNRPDQVTLVPDPPDVLTSDRGWDTVSEQSFLREVTDTLRSAGIRVSIFVDAEEWMVEGAARVGADRIELYTGRYAHRYRADRQEAVAAHRRCAELAVRLGMGVNAGHDLNLDNLAYYRQSVPHLMEVSIGHALVCDALYYGLSNTIQLYLTKLKEGGGRTEPAV